MKLSVIVPVYNVEAWLETCVKSILAQSFDDFELLLVDDRSPDRCGDLCEELARTDRRIRVFHHADNKGLSGARNTGLDNARGEYIAFVDSDDFIAEDTFQNAAILDEEADIDIVEFPIHVDYGSPKAYVLKPERIDFKLKTAFDQWVEAKGYYHCYSWNKIYRRRVWEKVRFPIGRCYEDVFTTPCVMQKARRIISSTKGLYYYCKRDGSISRLKSKKVGFDFLSAELALFALLKKSPYFTKSDADLYYLTMGNWQINYLRVGGELMLPAYRIDLARLMAANISRGMKLKALAFRTLGNSYFTLWAKMLNWIETK